MKHIETLLGTGDLARFLMLPLAERVHAWQRIPVDQRHVFRLKFLNTAMQMNELYDSKVFAALMASSCCTVLNEPTTPHSPNMLRVTRILSYPVFGDCVLTFVVSETLKPYDALISYEGEPRNNDLIVYNSVAGNMSQLYDAFRAMTRAVTGLTSAPQLALSVSYTLSSNERVSITCRNLGVVASTTSLSTETIRPVQKVTRITRQPKFAWPEQTYEPFNGRALTCVSEADYNEARKRGLGEFIALPAYGEAPQTLNFKETVYAKKWAASIADVSNHIQNTVSPFRAKWVLAMHAPYVKPPVIRVTEVLV